MEPRTPSWSDSIITKGDHNFEALFNSTAFINLSRPPTSTSRQKIDREAIYTPSVSSAILFNLQRLNAKLVSPYHGEQLLLRSVDLDPVRLDWRSLREMSFVTGMLGWILSGPAYHIATWIFKCIRSMEFVFQRLISIAEHAIYRHK